MGILTEDMKRVVLEQRLGFVATVCPDGTPNLSPKGTTTVWDDDHLVFADICSPGTIENLRHNPASEINVVDPEVRKGYRFKGTAVVLTEGAQFEEILAFYRQRGTQHPIRSIVLVKVERALPLISPAYDVGATEDEVRAYWKQYRASLTARIKVESPIHLTQTLFARVGHVADMPLQTRFFLLSHCIRALTPISDLYPKKLM